MAAVVSDLQNKYANPNRVQINSQPDKVVPIDGTESTRAGSATRTQTRPVRSATTNGESAASTDGVGLMPYAQAAQDLHERMYGSKLAPLSAEATEKN